MFVRVDLFRNDIFKEGWREKKERLAGVEGEGMDNRTATGEERKHKSKRLMTKKIQNFA